MALVHTPAETSQPEPSHSPAPDDNDETALALGGRDVALTDAVFSTLARLNAPSSGSDGEVGSKENSPSQDTLSGQQQRPFTPNPFGHGGATDILADPWVNPNGAGILAIRNAAALARPLLRFPRTMPRWPAHRALQAVPAPIREAVEVHRAEALRVLVLPRANSPKQPLSLSRERSRRRRRRRAATESR